MLQSYHILQAMPSLSFKRKKVLRSKFVGFQLLKTWLHGTSSLGKRSHMLKKLCTNEDMFLDNIVLLFVVL